MSNTRDTGFLRNAVQVTNQGIVFVSGSTTLMSISSSGAVTTTGVISGSNALSSSFSLNSALLNGTGSVGFTTTASFLAVSSSQQQISSSQQQISASLLNVVANYATTGSNSFRANQSITGSLVVSSTITAQTLVVQTVTSSIVYSSGSNVFGSQLGNTQTFTGSVNITGSLTVNTTGTEFQVNNNGVILGNLLTDNHSITGSLRVTGSNAIFAGSVGIGTTNPTVKLQVTMNAGSGYPTLGVGNSGSLFIAGDTNLYGLYVGNDWISGNAWLQSMRNNTATAYNIILNPVGGNVLIGTTTDNGSKLQVTGAIRASGNITSVGRLAINKTDTTTLGASIDYDSAINQVYIFNHQSNGYFSVYTNGVERLNIASTGAATFGSDVFTYANGGIFFNGGGSYGSGIFQQSGGALALQTGTTPRLTIASNGAATFNSSIDVTTDGSFGFQDYRTQATQKVLVLRGEGVSGNYAPSLFNIYTKPGTTSNGIASLIIKSKYGSEAESGNLFEFKGNGEAIFGSNISANNIKILSFTLQGLSTPVSTGLSINGFGGGRTYLLATSQQWSDGNSTSATITMIRCGYDGNNFTAVVLGSSNATVETWSQSGGILHVTGNTNFQLDVLVLSNG